MNRRRIIILGASLVLVGALLWILFRPGPREPVYQGKTLTQWLQLYKTQPKNWDHYEEPAEWGQADLAIRQMGTNAYPKLLEMIQAYDAPWKLKLIALAQKQHFIVIHHVPAEDRRQVSAMALERLVIANRIGALWVKRTTTLSQAQIDQLLPTLLRIVEQDTPPPSGGYSPFVVAAELLGAMGPAARQAVPALLRGATNTNYGIDYTCVVSLGRIGTDPEKVVPVLIKMLGHTNNAMRRNAADALGDMHALPELSVPALITALKDPDVVNVEQSAVHALPKFGAAAKSAAPALLEFVKRQPRGAQFLIQPASEAIWKIDPEFAAAHESEIGRPMVITR